MKDLKHRKCPLGPAFVGNILASRERAVFGSRIPVMKLLENFRADMVAARGVHKRGMSVLRRRAGRPT